jgi:SRSO17 transposase
MKSCYALHRPEVQCLAKSTVRTPYEFSVEVWARPRRPATQATPSSRFAVVRVRPWHRDYWRSTLCDEEWLPTEWPEGVPEPVKYWLSTLPESTALDQLVNVAKMRWRIERDYQELKQELGLGHLEGRGS